MPRKPKIDWSYAAVPKKAPTRLQGQAYKEFREKVWNHYGGICQVCERWIQLYDQDGQMDNFTCAHVAHGKSRGAGGADEIKNASLKCPTCHLQLEHGPQWTASERRLT